MAALELVTIKRPSPVRRVRKKRVPEWVLRYLSRTKGGPVSTLGALADTMAEVKQDIKAHCIEALSELGASKEYCEFFADILQTEHDMNVDIYKIQQDLKPEDNGGPIDPATLLIGLQELTRYYNRWKGAIDALQQRGAGLPALEVDPARVKQSRVLKLLCSLETKDINLHEGEQITIKDVRRNNLKVLTAHGSEAVVPALCCILPTPDKTAMTATERLRIQLLCSWTEFVRKTKRLLSESLLTNCKKLAREWKPPTENGPSLAKDRVGRRVRRVLDCATRAPHCDYNRLHSCLFSLERELSSYSVNGADLSMSVCKIANLDKSVLCFYNFYKQWHAYRRELEMSSVRPIRVVESLLELRRKVPHGRNYKYLEYKMTMENVETVEEIVYINEKENIIEGTSSSGFGTRTEKVEADQITSTEVEERKRFIIRGVIDPRDKKRVISIRDAIAEGIVDQDRGVYVNPDTGECCPIPEAMNERLILVEFETSTRSLERTKAIGLITIRTPDESQPYKVTGALDPLTGERIPMAEAKRRGLVDESETEYRLPSSSESFPIHEAVMCGWVLAEFSGGSQRFDTKTYAVGAVVDQRIRKKIPFHEAVRRGLIDKATGTYINNATGERIYVVDAIRRGFLKARLLDDVSGGADVGLDVDAENRMVVEKVDKIRKSVLKSVGVIEAFRKAAKKGSPSADRRS